MGKVLIIDDSIAIRDNLKGILTSMGHEVIEAADGSEGFQVISESVSELDLIICDVNMPNMNGVEMMEKVHANNIQPLPKVFMLTTEGGSDLKSRSKEAGVSGWILKPLTENKIRMLVERHVS